MSFDFYEALTDKKEEARLKSAQKAVEEPTAPSEKAAPPPAKAEAKPQPGRAQEKKQGQPPSPSTAMTATAPTPFAVQVASLKDSTKATELVSTLKGKGYTAYSVKVRIPKKGTYYRVRVGHFKNRHDAGQILAELRQGSPQLDPMIVRE